MTLSKDDGWPEPQEEDLLRIVERADGPIHEDEIFEAWQELIVERWLEELVSEGHLEAVEDDGERGYRLPDREPPSHSLDGRRAAAQRGQTRGRVPSAEMLSRLQACAEELGHTPGMTRFDKWAGRKVAQTYTIRFGSWRRACELAGLTPNERQPQIGLRKYSDEDLRSVYLRISSAVNQPPSLAQWDAHRRPDEPLAVTVRRRYGNQWVAFLDAMGADYEVGRQPLGSANDPAPRPSGIERPTDRPHTPVR